MWKAPQKSQEHSLAPARLTDDNWAYKTNTASRSRWFFANPIEKYACQIGNLPIFRVKIKNIWNHQLETNKLFWSARRFEGSDRNLWRNSGVTSQVGKRFFLNSQIYRSIFHPVNLRVILHYLMIPSIFLLTIIHEFTNLKYVFCRYFWVEDFFQIQFLQALFFPSEVRKLVEVSTLKYLHFPFRSHKGS